MAINGNQWQVMAIDGDPRGGHRRWRCGEQSRAAASSGERSGAGSWAVGDGRREVGGSVPDRRLWESMGGYGRVWEAMGEYGRVWERTGSEAPVAAIVASSAAPKSILPSHIMPEITGSSREIMGDHGRQWEIMGDPM